MLQLEGAPASRPFHKVPMTTQTFFSGLVTQRSPFNSMDNRVNRRYLGGRPDQLIDGLNVELTNIGTYIRRFGTSIWCSTTVAETNINDFYAFHQLDGSIKVMMDGAASIWNIDRNFVTDIFNKTAGSGQTYFEGVAGTLYMGDGVDQIAWDGTNAVRNWGIVAPSPAGSSSAYAGTGAGTSWTNPTNIQGAPDGAYATNTFTVNANTPTEFTNEPAITASNYSFSITPGAVITGIQVVLTGFTAAFGIPIAAQLVYNGSTIGAVKKLNASAGPPTVNLTYGSATDTWGASLSSSIVNSSTFGVKFFGRTTNASGSPISYTVSLDAAQITVFETGAPSATPTGSGSLTTTNGGWSYVYAYGNSASGHVSNPTLPSAFTGNFTSKASVNVPVVASTDTQVNQILLYRTKDGGAVYYLQGVYANTSTTIVDTSTDAQLNTLVFWPSIPWVGNTPPPTGIGKLTYHLGRLWGAVGNYVYWSGGPDTTIGNGNEAWPPANFFLFPATVNRLVPYASGLLVFTVDSVWIILGTSTATFYPMIFQEGVGLLNYNALDVQGTTIFLYTSDKQFLSLSSSGINEIGYAIGDQLEGSEFDPTKVHVASIIAGTAEKAVYVSDGVDDWFRCNWNQPPEGGPAWSPKANILGGTDALTSIETTPGQFQLLMAGYSGNNAFVFFRDTTTYQDSTFTQFTTTGTMSAGSVIVLVASTAGAVVGGTITINGAGPGATNFTSPIIAISGNFITVNRNSSTMVTNAAVFINGQTTAPYESFLTIGSLVLAQPGQLAEVDSLVLELVNVGSVPTVSIRTEEIGGAFEALTSFTPDPPMLVPSSTVMSNRWYLSQGPNAALLRHMQVEIDYGIDTVRNELLTFSVFGGLIHQS